MITFEQTCALSRLAHPFSTDPTAQLPQLPLSLQHEMRLPIESGAMFGGARLQPATEALARDMIEKRRMGNLLQGVEAMLRVTVQEQERGLQGLKKL
jgi:hypothetical protein